MGKKSPPPQPPNLQPITDAQLRIAKESNDLAREQLGMSREQFAWFKENAQEELALARQQAEELAAYRDKVFASDEEAKQFSRQVGQTQIDAMNLQMDYAKKDRARYESVFLPREDAYLQEVDGYDTPERRDQAAAQAQVDIQRQADAARANADQRLRSMGVDPSQIRSASMLNQLSVATSANQALAGNNARTMIEDKGRALRADALNMGKGLPAQAAMGFQGSAGSGGAAMGAALGGQGATLNAVQGGAGVMGTALGFRSSALNNVAALTGSPMQWAQMGGQMMGQAASTYGMAANTMNQGFQNQMQSWKAGQEQAQQQFNNIMSVASLAGGMMMAEGGAVRAAGGGAASLLKKAAGGAGGKAMDKAKGAINVTSAEQSTFDKVKEQWAQKRAANDQYTRTGKGSGEGGALNFSDRLSNGMTAAQNYSATATNVYADGTSGRQPIADLSQMPGFAEGGHARVRGALPVRQSRDNIPAFLTEGEYVVPRDVVQAKGIEFFDKLVQKYHRENS